MTHDILQEAEFRVEANGIDLPALFSKDTCGPQGAGELYVKPGVPIQRVLLDGDQERRMRSTTEELFTVAGMGEVAHMVMKEMMEGNESEFTEGGMV